MPKETVINLVVKRDGISYLEAEELVDHVAQDLSEMVEGGYSLVDAEDHLREELGLEPDYLFDLIS